MRLARRPRNFVAMSACAVLAGCAGANTLTGSASTASTIAQPKATVRYTLPPPPPSASGPLPQDVVARLPRVVGSLEAGKLDRALLSAIGASRDGRLGWMLSDLLRFSGEGDTDVVVAAFVALTGVDESELRSTDIRSPWQAATDLLFAWDLPAPPGYVMFKRDLFLAIEPRWAPFFDDVDADIDWRLLSWGGVLIDDRRLGDKEPCTRGCIPALDDPVLTDADGGNWYPAERIVFGLAIDGEYVALPKNQMEVHEMVNLTIAGHRIAVPYCTLCGSAQAYRTDEVVGAGRPLVMRTSGLLSLSNKVMYDLDSKSVFDTFTGRAVSGPLHRKGVVLPMVTTVVSTWGAWRTAHPSTRIVRQDGGIGRTYGLDPLHGRDDNGPIFPIRRADQRLPVHTQVLGVLTSDSPAVAFPVDAVKRELEAGRVVRAEGVEVISDGGGLVAMVGATPVATHQAFWFAWAQFHPGTALWQP